MSRSEFIVNFYDARNKALGRKFKVVTNDNRRRARAFLEDQLTISIQHSYQHLIMPPNIIIKANKCSEVASIQNTIVPATKVGGGR